MNWKQTIGLFLNDDGGVVCNAFFAFLIVFFLLQWVLNRRQVGLCDGAVAPLCLNAFMLAKVTNCC